MGRREDIEELLSKNFQILYLKVTDESGKHAGHLPVLSMNAGTHFSITLVTQDFEGLSRLQRHRLIQQCLAEEFRDGLHALAIRAMAPSEWNPAELKEGGG